MGNAILSYEIKAWLKYPLFYMINLGFFLFAWVTFLGTGGYFDGEINPLEPVAFLNTPYALCGVSFLFAKLLMFVVGIFGGYSLYKDYRNQTHSFLYTYPISKQAYLTAKLISALFPLVVVSILLFLGIGIGEIMLGLSNPKIGPINVLGYLIGVGIYLIPTLITAGLFVFVVVGITRNIYSGFVVVICLVLLQLLFEQFFFNQKTWLALLDPFGQNAFHLATQEWDFKAKNSMATPINTIVIANRVLWLLLGIGAYWFFSRVFDFQYAFEWPSRRSLDKDEATTSHKTKVDLGKNIQYQFSIRAKIKCLWQLVWYDFKSIILSWLFLVPTLIGIATIVFIQLKVTNTGDIKLLPLTRLFLLAPLSIYAVLIVLCTFLFTGLLINRARQYNMNLMIDVSPVSNWQLVLAKIGAISLIHAVQLFLFMVVGMVIQVGNDYNHFEISLYLFHLFILLFPVLLVWNITSHFIHNLASNLFLGLLLLLILWLEAQSLEDHGHSNQSNQIQHPPSIGIFRFQWIPTIKWAYKPHSLLGWDSVCFC